MGNVDASLRLIKPGNVKKEKDYEGYKEGAYLKILHALHGKKLIL